MTQPTKLQRQLDLIAYLVGRHMPVAVEELMERIPAYASKWKLGDATSQQTARRTFERDKDDLRHSGIPLRTLTYTRDGEEIDGYVIDRKDFYLPYLKLVAPPARKPPSRLGRDRPATVDIAEQDAPLALEALRRVAEVPSFPLAAEARSAFRKLAFDLAPDAFAQPSVLFLDRPGAAELTDRLRTLSDALLARKRVTFAYRGMYRDDQTDRAVAPYGLLFQHGHWYLIGRDETRDDVRVFRVGRIQELKRNTRSPGTPDYKIPTDFKLDAYAGRQAWELGDLDEAPILAKVLFRFPRSLWAARNQHGTLQEERPDGTVVRGFEIQQVNPFLRWLLTLEADAEILEPLELREELRGMARDIAHAHAEVADDHR